MKTILFVDDDATTLTLYRQRFEQAGFNVLTVFNGKTGLAMALREHPDVIVLDIQMPGLNGMAVLKKLRLDAWGKSVPIIMLTNFDTDTKTLSEVAEYQPTYYFLKDKFGPSELLEKVAEL